MIRKKYLVFIFFTVLSLLLLVGCSRDKAFVNEPDSTNGNQVAFDDSEGSENIKTESESMTMSSSDSGDGNDTFNSTNIEETMHNIFGTWSLEKVVLKSDAYDGTTKEALGGIDEQDYIGLELEFADKYLRLDDDKFSNPKYTLKYVTLKEYNDGGNFRNPDAYDFILNENIDVLNSDKYEWLSEVPLELYQADFDEDYCIPVGSQVVVLNKDTILVGIWGEIILAHRVKTNNKE